MGWRLRIRHVTGFTYAGTAHASYNEARMTPMTGAGQTSLFTQIECAPSASTWRYRDYWGTQVSVFDLQRPHQQLRVTASSLVETNDRVAPVNNATWADLESTVDRFAELLAPTELTTVDAELADVAREQASGRDPTAAAVAIADWVRSTV